MTTYFADLNPAYPAKGERRYCVYARELGELNKCPRQFNALRSAERFAFKLQVRHEQQMSRRIYVGD